MSTLLFYNNAGTTLAGAITSTAVTLNVSTGSGALFTPGPSAGQYFVATLISATNPSLKEIVWVTAVSGDTITIQRAQEGTTALNWSAGDYFRNLWTAGQAAAMAQTVNVNGVSTANWTAGRSQDLYIDRANAGMTGGGVVSISSIGELNWTARFIASSLGQGPNEVNSYLEIDSPVSGQTVPVTGGAVARTITSGGIAINAGESLYWLPTFGGAPTAGSFLLSSYTATWEPPLNAVLIATRNLDSGLYKLAIGITIRVGDPAYDTTALSSASPPSTLALYGVVNIATTGGSKTLTPTQYGNGIINVTGALTSNAVLVMPVNGRWTVYNQTSGAYTLTLITASGSGYVVRQGFRYKLYGDGANIVPDGENAFNGTATTPSPALQLFERYDQY